VPAPHSERRRTRAPAIRAVECCCCCDRVARVAKLADARDLKSVPSSRTKTHRAAACNGITELQIRCCCELHRSAGNYKTNSHQNSHRDLRLN